MGLFNRKREMVDSPVEIAPIGEVTGRVRKPTVVPESLSRASMPPVPPPIVPPTPPPPMPSVGAVFGPESAVVEEAARVLSEDYLVIGPNDLVQMTPDQREALQINLLFGLFVELRKLNEVVRK